MKVFLDSCFLIYLNTMTHEERSFLDQLFNELLKDQLFINMLIIDETLYVSKKYGVPYDVTFNFLRSIVLPYVEVVPIDEGDFRPMEKYLVNYNLKPSDAIHLATIEKVGASSIVSEDEEFDKIGEVKRIWINIQ
ncbi:MAG: type II toxin-antitoxin system VapC family toxin [Crenarchaeota archaeon]|nr:type II toxin-antitoxin system VapC family toxin [Thermoproteota archaeon]MDW8033741.1 type II toxin-antitoxin system VapC family toxin [Nitrososphaerota archaeon]